MKAHITLANPPYPSGAPQAFFIPLSIGYLAAVLEKEGYTVDVIDCQLLKPTKKQLERELDQLQPDVVGVTSTTLTYNPAREIVKTTKEAYPNCLTIMGGPHVTVMDEQTLNENPEADIIIRGEGEQTILEIANLVSKSNLKDLDKVAGITFRKNGQIVQTTNRPFIQNLDELPYPAFHHFEVSKYRIFGKIYLPIISTRGCPFQCTFCSASRMCGKRIRARSPNNFVNELELLNDTYNPDAVIFYDDVFTLDTKRAFEICDEIKNRNLDIQWDCRTRVDLVSKEILAKIRDTNCQRVFYGIESGCQTILNAMKKGTTVEQGERAIKWAKEVGLFVDTSVIFGYPGETKDMLKQTLDFIKKTKPDAVYPFVANPYPGTEIRKHTESMGWKMSSDWSLYDTMKLVSENPLLSAEEIRKAKRTLYNSFYSPSYILCHSLKGMKGNFYSQIMARTALNHFLWRLKLPLLFSKILKKLSLQR
ncbi:radical SAM protein [archaeon]|nr:radical SAM protein [archaeon]